MLTLNDYQLDETKPFVTTGLAENDENEQVAQSVMERSKDVAKSSSSVSDRPPYSTNWIKYRDRIVLHQLDYGPERVPMLLQKCWLGSAGPQSL